MVTDQPITLAELKFATFQFPAAKTPGCDGIPALVYQVLWEELGPLLHEAITYGLVMVCYTFLPDVGT